MNFLVRFLGPLMLVAAVSGVGAQPHPIPVETLFQKAKYGGARLSPSGDYLAVLTPAKDRRNIAIIDLKTRAAQLLTGLEDSDVVAVTWLSDERLMFTLGDLQTGTGEAPRVWGMFAIDRDGKELRDLRRRFERPWGVSFRNTILGSEDIMVTARDRDLEQADLYRLNTRTGDKELLSFKTPGKVSGWLLDFDNVPRAIFTDDLEGDRSAWYVRADSKAEWKLMEEAKLNALKSGPVAFSADGKFLYVSSRLKRDRTAIFEYDIGSGKMSTEPVVQHPERDVTGSFLISRSERKLRGFWYEDDRPAVVWFDVESANMQKGVDNALKDTVNNISKSERGNKWLIVSSSDQVPGRVHLLDGKTGKMEKLFDYAQWIQPDEMSSTRWISYQARDGLKIPAMLTVPKGMEGKKVPLIVEIHGGPYVDATTWGFDREVQFFASRGYAVLQPQFRGTDGFGEKHFTAGFRKWGDEMQDDLEDGVKHLIKEGIVNPDKVCFFGASYGGYAAMWGAIKNKDLIKCSVAFVGVSSIDFLFDNKRTDIARLVERSSETVVKIGNPLTERARFKRVNPLDNADKVGVPILLAYGVEDRRVPLVHGTAFKDALDKAGKTYEWVAYEKEAHGFSKSENVFDFYNRVDKFLAKYLQ